jgi:hypothetical protein
MSQRISFYVQLIAFPLGLLTPPAIYLLAREWQLYDILALTVFPLGIGVLAALWNFIIWRREL